MNESGYFDQYQNAPVLSPLYQNAMRFYQAGQFEYDASHDRLPTVLSIIPTSYQVEHPDFMPAPYGRSCPRPRSNVPKPECLTSPVAQATC